MVETGMGTDSTRGTFLNSAAEAAAKEAVAAAQLALEKLDGMLVNPSSPPASISELFYAWTLAAQSAARIVLRIVDGPEKLRHALLLAPPDGRPETAKLLASSVSVMTSDETLPAYAGDRIAKMCRRLDVQLIGELVTYTVDEFAKIGNLDEVRLVAMRSWLANRKLLLPGDTWDALRGACQKVLKVSDLASAADALARDVPLIIPTELYEPLATIASTAEGLSIDKLFRREGLRSSNLEYLLVELERAELIEEVPGQTCGRYYRHFQPTTTGRQLWMKNLIAASW